MMRLSRREFLIGSGVTALSFYPRLLPALQSTSDWHELNRPMIGTFVAIGIYHADRTAALALIEGCFDYFSSLLPAISTWDEGGVPLRLAEKRSLKASEIPEALKRSILIGQKILQLTGAFNILSQPITSLWKEAKACLSIPSQRDINTALDQVTRSHITFGSDLSITGTASFDLDGIGQGVLADCCAEYLQAQGIQQGRIDIGGDLRFIGDTVWKIEIEDPRRERITKTITVNGALGVCTSGDSRNYWFVNGRRYHHLIDLKSGYPANHNQQVTVVAPNATLADALASALFLLPEKHMRMIISSLKGIQLFAVDRDGRRL